MTIRIQVTPDLTPAKAPYRDTKGDLIKSLEGKDQYGYSTLPEDSYHYHMGLLEYLSLAYASHNNPVFTPDMVYYAIMCEVAGVIKESPETYRSLFTTSDKKEEILVPMEEMRNGVPVLNMRSFSGELAARVPGGIETYLFPFSTTGEEEAFALQASFMDAVSPYYSYSMFMCGFPEVVLEGTREDWFKILGACASLQDRLGSLDPEVGAWLEKVGTVVTKFLSAYDVPDTAQWSQMFWSEACGSGSEQFVRGWILDLYRKHPTQVPKWTNFSTHVAEVPYTDDQENKYVCRAGLLHSSLKGNDLVPAFAHVVYRQAE